jgi:hypothetical protein
MEWGSILRISRQDHTWREKYAAIPEQVVRVWPKGIDLEYNVTRYHLRAI